MALDAANVAVAVTGSVKYAPIATAIPNDAYEALNVAFVDVGYISDEGVTESHGTETNDIVAWQNGAVVRRVRTSHVLTYQFTMLETNPNSMALFYDTYSASGGTTGTATVTGTEHDEQRFVIDVVDGTDNIRIVIPNGQITELGDVSYVNGDAIARPITITAYPETSTNVKAYVYLGGSLSA